MKTLIIGLSLFLLTGCALERNYVITGTGTVLGVQIAQNQVTGAYEAKFGYSRAEAALVPTNGVSVIMELRYSGIFSANGGIYQRLAVGDAAVRQPGAAFMFAKDANGNVSSNLVESISRKLENSIPLAPK